MDLLALSLVQADRLNLKIFLRNVDLFCVLLGVVLEACDTEIPSFSQCFPLRLNILGSERCCWSEIEQLHIRFLQKASQRSRFFWRSIGRELAPPRGLYSLPCCTAL